MRKLLTNDLFKFTRLIKEIGIKEDIKQFSLTIDKQQNIEAIGFDFIFVILEKTADEKSERLIYEFLSGPFEMTADEVANMEVFELVEAINKIADLEKWRNFLKIATR